MTASLHLSRSLHSRPRSKGRSRILAVVVLGLLSLAATARAEHPCLYAGKESRAEVLAKIHQEKWASEAWVELLRSIDPAVYRNKREPGWIVSRMSMYWKEGERYTQCYLKKENWDRGEGNAPVPTVRLPGMRTWNDFVNVPLEERTPYNETGDMLARSRKDPNAPPVLVPYKQSGHLVRGNNDEILTLAEKAAFAYWITNDNDYGHFAADIFWAWTLGTYYMEPPLDPDRSTGGPGGYAPGGVAGYYDYEQIHDDLMMHAAATYDFLYDYLAAYPDARLASLHLKFPEVATTVFKRFIDIGLVRGGRTGNWNVNGWNVMMRGILVLDSNASYPDGHGREYYLENYTTKSTAYHQALPDILKEYDPVTGLWPESPGYALGTIATIVDLAIPLRLSGVDTVRDNPIMQKAALALFPWLDARGNTVVFGDGRGGPANYSTFERLLTYYTWAGDRGNAEIAASALRKGLQSGAYDRSMAGWQGLCVNVAKLPEANPPPPVRTAFSAAHRHLVMKNLDDPKNGLMFTLYGGTKGKHLSPNGLALQLYGKGWALAPDASAYESYWSKDAAYHQGAAGSNTILPGYTDGPITINALEPAPAPESFTNNREISASVSFADFSAAEKRRLVSIVRTSPTTGYYVDIFRSGQANNDYVYHNVGDRMVVTDTKGTPLTLTETANLEPVPAPSYSYFNAPRRVTHDGAFRATWVVTRATPAIAMDLWMLGGGARDLFQVEAPPTTLVSTVVPAGASLAPEGTQTLIVRQTGRNGWTSPFVAVFEPHDTEKPSIRSVSPLPSGETFVGVAVESADLGADSASQKDYILNAVDEMVHAPTGDIEFRGIYGVISTTASQIKELYLGRGRFVRFGKYKVEAARDVSAGLVRRDAFLHYSADSEVSLTLPHEAAVTGSRYERLRLFYKESGRFVEAPGSANAEAKIVTGVVPSGYDRELRIAETGTQVSSR